MENENMIDILKNRFFENLNRHKDISWHKIEDILNKNEKILTTVTMMEQTGGEPDVIIFNGKMMYCDCSKESPALRRNLCYDELARIKRKSNPPVSSAMEEATKMGVRLITESEYRYLQTLGEFDLKTSSWIFTPENIRNLGGAIFCERRYNEVFTFHNGADSYYGVRGFRSVVELNWGNNERIQI